PSDRREGAARAVGTGGDGPSDRAREGVVPRLVAERRDGPLDRPPAGPVAGGAVDDQEAVAAQLAPEGPLDEPLEVAVGEPERAVPVVGQRLGAVRAVLDPADAEGDEAQLEGQGEAAAEPLADELGDGVGPVRAGLQVLGDRPLAGAAVAPHDVAAAGED